MTGDGIILAQLIQNLHKCSTVL